MGVSPRKSLTLKYVVTTIDQPRVRPVTYLCSYLKPGAPCEAGSCPPCGRRVLESNAWCPQRACDQDVSTELPGFILTYTHLLCTEYRTVSACAFQQGKQSKRDSERTVEDRNPRDWRLRSAANEPSMSHRVLQRLSTRNYWLESQCRKEVIVFQHGGNRR